MILVEMNYIVPLTKIEEYTASHRSWLDIQVEQGLILCAGPKVPRTGGIVIVIGKDKAFAEELFKQDPFSINQLAQFTFTEFVAGKQHNALKGILAG